MTVAGILLTGGGSTRMGCDKATLRLAGSTETLAQRIGRLLREVAVTCIEVGPGHSGLPAVEESPRRGGPLVALACGWEALAASSVQGPVLVVATDLPNLDVATLRWLASRPGAGSVVPVVDGRPQPLCARWSSQDLEVARDLVANGQRALYNLMQQCTPELLATDGGGGPGHAPFADADTPPAARKLGLAVPPP